MSAATCPEDTYVMCGIPATPLPEPRTVQLVTDLATTGGPHPAIILALIAAGLALVAIGVLMVATIRLGHDQRRIHEEAEEARREALAEFDAAVASAKARYADAYAAKLNHDLGEPKP